MSQILLFCFVVATFITNANFRTLCLPSLISIWVPILWLIQLGGSTNVKCKSVKDLLTINFHCTHFN